MAMFRAVPSQTFGFLNREGARCRAHASICAWLVPLPVAPLAEFRELVSIAKFHLGETLGDFYDEMTRGFALKMEEAVPGAAQAAAAQAGGARQG